MSPHPTGWRRVTHLLSSHLSLALIASYAAAAFFPKAGRALRDLHFGSLPGSGATLHLSVTMLLLAALLVNSGLSAQTAHLREVLKRPQRAVGGVLLNAALPVAFLFGLAPLLRLWSVPQESQLLLMGLSLVGAMPIAASSTAWTAKGNGNVALNLGLVVGSTIAGPILTPAILRFGATLLQGEYAERLRSVAVVGGGSFLFFSVVVPSIIGLGLRLLLGEKWVERLRPTLQPINLGVLLLLNYSNASFALPLLLRQRSVPFLLLMGFCTLLLCVGTFTAGALLARTMRMRRDEEIALIFGLGMNNNGGGLVLATHALASHPLVQLPLLTYNLLQHLIAAIVEKRLGLHAVRTPPRPAIATIVASSYLTPRPTASTSVPTATVPAVSGWVPSRDTPGLRARPPR